MKMSNYFLTLMHFIPALKDGAFVLRNGKPHPVWVSPKFKPQVLGVATSGCRTQVFYGATVEEGGFRFVHRHHSTGSKTHSHEVFGGGGSTKPLLSSRSRRPMAV